MITQAVTTIYGREESAYNRTVDATFTIGDAIRKARKKLGWNQERLGEEAARFRLGRSSGPLAINTVSKVENDPYSSEFATVVRLAFAVKLTLADVSRLVEEATTVTARTPKKRAV